MGSGKGRVRRAHGALDFGNYPTGEYLRTLEALHHMTLGEPRRNRRWTFLIAEQLGEDNHYRVAAWLTGLRRNGLVVDVTDAKEGRRWSVTPAGERCLSPLQAQREALVVERRSF
jgi:hypothetical protein